MKKKIGILYDAGIKWIKTPLKHEEKYLKMTSLESLDKLFDICLCIGTQQVAVTLEKQDVVTKTALVDFI